MTLLLDRFYGTLNTAGAELQEILFQAMGEGRDAAAEDSEIPVERLTARTPDPPGLFDKLMVTIVYENLAEGAGIFVEITGRGTPMVTAQMATRQRAVLQEFASATATGEIFERVAAADLVTEFLEDVVGAYEVDRRPLGGSDVKYQVDVRRGKTSGRSTKLNMAFVLQWLRRAGAFDAVDLSTYYEKPAPRAR